MNNATKGSIFLKLKNLKLIGILLLNFFGMTVQDSTSFATKNPGVSSRYSNVVNSLFILVKGFKSELFYHKTVLAHMSTDVRFEIHFRRLLNFCKSESNTETEHSSNRSYDFSIVNQYVFKNISMP